MNGVIRFMAVGLATALASVQLCFATIINVPSDQPTIQAGIDVAANGDTVLVAPGMYSENLSINSIPVTLFAVAGPDSTVLSISEGDNLILNNVQDDTCRLIGFGLINSGTGRGVASNHSKFVIEKCVFIDVKGSCVHLSHADGIGVVRHNIFTEAAPPEFPSTCVYSDNAGNLSLIRNVFYDIRRSSLVVAVSGYSEIINNTFVSALYGLQLHSAVSGNVYNNILSNIRNYAIYMGSSYVDHDYNLFYKNGDDIGWAQPGDHSLIGDPLFHDPLAHDYRLLPMSPCIDSGKPDPWFRDPDGSRNDIGALFTGCDDSLDTDEDGAVDICDNCRFTNNPNQTDSDYDYIGDACDICPGDSLNDDDDDGICGSTDNCPKTPNPDQADNDGDGIGNLCDDCDCTFFCDLDLNRAITPLDVAIIVNYVYKQRDSRTSIPTSCPNENGDWDCNGGINSTDVTLYVDYVYRRNGLGPCHPCAE